MYMAEVLIGPISGHFDDDKKITHAKGHGVGTSLEVQWLRLNTPNAVDPGSIPDQGTRSHMPQLRVCMPQLKDPGACRNEDPTCHNQDPARPNK